MFNYINWFLNSENVVNSKLFCFNRLINLLNFNSTVDLPKLNLDLLANEIFLKLGDSFFENSKGWI